MATNLGLLQTITNMLTNILNNICLVKLPLDDTETLFESELELDGPRDTNW